MSDKQSNENNEKSDHQSVWPDSAAEDGASVSSSTHEIELYVDLAESKDFSDFMNRILSRLNSLGFYDYTFSRHQTSEDIEVPLGNAPNELIKIYQKEAFAEHDLVLDYIEADNQDPIFHSIVSEYADKAPFLTETIKRNREILKLNRSFGRFDNYIVPFEAHDGSGHVLFTITGKNIDPSDFKHKINRHRSAIKLLGEAVDYIGIRKFPDFFLDDNKHSEIVIHPRPLMLLNTLAKNNLSLTQAADKMCISIDTVNKHVAAAKKALGARTIATAVYRAIKEGLIDYKD